MTYFRSLFSILDKKFKKFLIFLILGMTISGILETIGIGLVIPIISFLLSSDSNNNYLNFDIFYLFDSIPLILTFTVLFYLLKGIYIVILHRLQIFFINKLRVSLTMSLYKKYLDLNYLDFIKNNTNFFLRNLSKEIPYFTHTHLNSLLFIIVETQLIFFILVFLCLIDTLVVFSVITTCSLFGFIFYKLSRNAINKWGNNRQIFDGNILKLIKESFYGYNDLKINNASSIYYNKILNDSNKIARLELNLNTLQVLPKNILEILALLILVGILIYSSQINKSNDEILILISLFGVSAFKLIPSISRIIAHSQNFMYTKPSLSLINDEFKDDRNSVINTNKRYSFKKNLELKDISFSYSNKNYYLRKINIVIPAYKITGIIGKSGSGKSTLINIIIGLIKPDSGEVLVDSQTITPNDLTWYDKIGYVTQSIQLIDSSIASNIAFGKNHEEIDYEKIELCLESVGIKEFIDTLPDKIFTKIGEMGSSLSGGQKQRICLARALYKNPDLLILDEATNSLDFNLESSILSNLESMKSQTNIILVTHNQDNLKYCDIAYEIKDGEVTKFK